MGLPTTESFSNKKKRKQLGQATVEGIKDLAIKIWDGIVSAIKKVIDWVKEIFNKIFGSSKKVKEKAEQTEQALSKAPDTVEESKEEEKNGEDSEKNESSPELEKIAVGTEIAKPEDFDKAAEIIKKVGEIQNEFVKDNIKIINETISDLNKSNDNKDGILKRMGEKTKNAFTSVFKRDANKSSKNISSNTDASATPVLPGNTSIILLDSHGIEIKAVKEDTKPDGSKIIVPSSSNKKINTRSEAEKYVNSIKKTLEAVELYSINVPKTNSEQQKCIKNVISAVRNVSKEDSKEKNDANLKTALSQLRKTFSDPLAKVCMGVMSSCNAMLNKINKDMKLKPASA